MQVRISTQNDQTTVTFTSHHAAVREVLDQGMARLKEMFSEQGLNLVQADVGERRGSDHNRQFSNEGAGVAGDADHADDHDVADGAPTHQKVSIGRGLIDAYA